MHRLNVVPSPLDTRDYLMGAPPHVTLPAADTLGDLIPPIKDQGQEGSCTGFSLSSAREALAKKQGNYVPFSPAFIYYEERVKERDTDQDNGANIRTGLEILRKVGVCPESDFPYQAGDFRTAPPQNAVADAGAYKILAYHRLTSLVALKLAIVARFPVVLGIAVYAGMEETRDGYVPMPAAGEASLGGHAILTVGYHDDAQAAGGGYLHLNNSWGTGAGDQGRYYIPYGYLSAASWNEMWVLA